MRPLHATRRRSSNRRITRQRCYAIEPLEGRWLLNAAPIANDDNYETAAGQSLVIGSPNGGTTSTIVPAGATWKYLDGGATPGENWRLPNFSDGAWKTGAAQLGYGDGDEATVVSFGPDANAKAITTYFRRRVTIDNAASLAALNLRLAVDDGAVVYVNGQEAARVNMPAGAINAQSLAAAATEGEWRDLSLTSQWLVNGDNVIAVEVHQASLNSTDISFDLALTSLGGVAPASGVLLNDYDADGNTLSAAVVASPNHGTLQLAANGSFVYTPTPGFAGADTFTYQASDSTTASNVATVTIQVTGVPPANHPPVAHDDEYTLIEHGDPNASHALLTADGGFDDQLGTSVAISGDLAVSGAPYNDDQAVDAGAVYVYRRTGDAWHQVAALHASDGVANDSFGASVAIAEGRIIVGAPYQGDGEPFYNPGAVYVFERVGDAWQQSAKLIAPDGSDENCGHPGYLGSSVAADGNWILAGAPSCTGSVAAFRYGDGGWHHVVQLVPDDGEQGDQFGAAVAISGNLAVIGSPENDPRGDNTGAAYVFSWDDGGWHQRALLSGSRTASDELFGSSVDIDGHTIVVGTASSETAYVYQGGGEGWNEIAVLESPDPNFGRFGSAVSIAGNVILVGAFEATISGEGQAGAAYRYVRTSDASHLWQLDRRFTSIASPNDDRFGFSVDVDRGAAGRMIVGSPLRSSGGAAYVLNEDSALGASVLSVSANDGVLANDTDADGDALSATLVGEPALGTVRFRSDGSLIYMPDTWLPSGFDQFSYAVTDSHGATSEPAYVRIHFENAGLNHAPVANDDHFSVSAGDSLEIGPDSVRPPAFFAEDFEFGASSAWSRTIVSQTPIGNRGFLGEFGPEHLALNLGGLPEHDTLTIEFDLFVLKSWDGNGGDFWRLATGDGRVLLNTTFAMAGIKNSDYPRQSFPDNYPADNRWASGAAEVDTLGYTFAGSAVYHLRYSIPHTADAVRYLFEAYGQNQEGVENESWGLDNVRVYAGFADRPQYGVLANDTDVDHDALTALLVSPPTHGALQLNADGTFRYTPEADYDGPDAFSYRAHDGTASSNVARVSIDVRGTTGMVSGMAWNDMTGDGEREEADGDAPIAGVVVRLLDGEFEFYATAMTDEQGRYQFANVAPGDYVVEMAPPEGAILTQANARDDSADSDLRREFGQSARIHVEAASHTEIDGGFYFGPLSTNVVDTLRITELQTGQGESDYVELSNVGSEPIDLTGVRFTDGVAFEFTGSRFTTLFPGEFVVVVENRTQFEQWPGATNANIAGEYFKHLSNEGERIELVDRENSIIQDFTYRGDWFEVVTRAAFAIVPRDPLQAAELWSSRDGWRPSRTALGSRGAPDVSELPLPGAIVINEVMSRDTDSDADWIELYNTTSADIDISNWFLGDLERDARPDLEVADWQPTNYHIPQGTVVPAHGYLVFNRQEHFGRFQPPGVLEPFGLSSYGDAVFLTAGNADGHLLGYSESAYFPGAQVGVSFGRHETSTGVAAFPPQLSPTRGGENAGPRTGDLIVSEIMYHPAFLHDEFIELFNTTDADLSLREPSILTPDMQHEIGWHLSGDIAYDFDAGQAVPAHGYALVVGIAPAEFRAKYAIPGDVQVLGPYSGNLDNGGGTVELRHRDNQIIFDDDGTIYRDRVSQVDVVHYDDQAPWPEDADLGGASLERRSPSLYGDDPINWSAAESFGGTPGAVNSVAASAAGDFNGDHVVNATDIDLLYAAMHAPAGDSDGFRAAALVTTSVIYDLTGDFTVDQRDVDFLVGSVLGTTYGDANLDGRVDLGDLLRVRDHLAATGGWAEGDFNGDRGVTTADLATLVRHFGKGQIASAAAEAVVTRAASLRTAEAHATPSERHVIGATRRTNASAVDAVLVRDSGIAPSGAGTQKTLVARRRAAVIASSMADEVFK